MAEPKAPRPRWSKRTDELVRHIAERVRPGLQVELAHWLENNARFRDFVAAHRDKIRKKLSNPDDEDHRLDVRAELYLAHVLLQDRRFDVAFEAYGAGRVGPDLTVTYRANQRFNLEVTRMRARSESTDLIGRLTNVIAGKLRQLPGDAPNALAIAESGATTDAVGAAMARLKTLIDAQDAVFFERRGLQTSRDAHAQWLRLSGVLLLESGEIQLNREARRAIPSEAVAAMRAMLS